MQYDEFIQRVQMEGGIEESDEAVKATEAFLGTLGECIYRTEEAQLAAQLPRDIAQFLTTHKGPETNRAAMQEISLEEFYQRVAARTNSRYPQAVKMSHAVAEVLMDAVSSGEMNDIKRELPAEFGKLFSREF
jgi:uncharacterized protein (DUF2267 family)